ncbi:hypothetical protein FF011L_42030 [Roseimaritima multifibrata]|uniref:Uncharacterized protein n=1 Tax=Roseimaritima multifibrata TaxID=1930274 RepID=A0A517MKU5_9BACT|nr:hypothetical protein FF011L_42030 [Roseimaritima multifibrata]
MSPYAQRKNVEVIARSRVSPRLVLANLTASERRSFERQAFAGTASLSLFGPAYVIAQPPSSLLMSPYAQRKNVEVIARSRVSPRLVLADLTASERWSFERGNRLPERHRYRSLVRPTSHFIGSGIESRNVAVRAAKEC